MSLSFYKTKTHYLPCNLAEKYTILFINVVFYCTPQRARHILTKQEKGIIAASRPLPFYAHLYPKHKQHTQQRLYYHVSIL